MGTRTHHDPDWLAVAIYRAGGTKDRTEAIKATAKLMRKRRATIEAWLRDGIGKMQVCELIKLAKVLNVVTFDTSILLLVKRTGPYFPCRDAVVTARRAKAA